MKKKILLSVSEFALPAPRAGSIDSYSGFGNHSLQGLELHKQIQYERKKEFSHYESEVFISREFQLSNFCFKVNGRMDGVYHITPFKIEEIKTSFNIYELYRYIKKHEIIHPYCLQLKTYGYFHWLHTGEIPELILHLVSTRKRDSLDLRIHLNVKTYEQWLSLRLQDLVAEIKLAAKTIKRRKKIAKDLTFPFISSRQGQTELIQTVEKAIKTEQPLLIQAPTGLGKTIGVLYPVQKEALERGQKVLYLTPKNSQHAIAEDAISRMQATGAAIKALTLTAKNKLCLKNEPICNSVYCEFAENHYTKVTDHQLPALLAKKKNLTPSTFKSLGEQYKVCPFELQFEVIKNRDTIICDYNYVFSPRGGSERITDNFIGEISKPNLIIDEVHNLPARGMDYYSPSLSIVIFETILKQLDQIPEAFRKKANVLLNECISIIKRCGPLDAKFPSQIAPPVIIFIKQDNKLRDFLSTYLNSEIEIQPEDLIMKFSFYWSEFTKALEFIALGRQEFFTTFYPEPATVKISCCDASELLKPCYDEFKHVVGFSATLKPFDFYSQLIGLKSKKLKTAEFTSPFSKTQRKLLIIPQISTKYSARKYNYPRIAEVIHKISALKPGNYLVFFPSFEFLEKTLQLFIPPPCFQVIEQRKGMKKEEVENILRQLNDETKSHLVFGVQGGILSEGIDYLGHLAIGVFIVGPPLPNFDLEQEKKKEYYHQHYAAGFEYAYVYPAMAKAVQAAGRVIRSETDKGLIVLMDNRFIQKNYTACMPQDWFETNCDELISNSILSDISDFWFETNQ